MGRPRKHKSKTTESKRILSIEALRRIAKAAKAPRFGGDLVDPVFARGTVFHDRLGIIHSIFREELDSVVFKSRSIAEINRRKTIMLKHVDQLKMSLGIMDDATWLPYVALAPIIRRIKRKNEGFRIAADAAKMALHIALHRTILAVRAGVGLNSHHGVKTLHTRDVINAGKICANYPQ